MKAERRRRCEEGKEQRELKKKNKKREIEKNRAIYVKIYIYLYFFFIYFSKEVEEVEEGKEGGKDETFKCDLMLLQLLFNLFFFLLCNC